MIEHVRGRDLIVDANVKDFFRGLVDSAVAENGLEATDDTVHYVVNLLTSFARSDHFFEWTTAGRAIQPLALTYAEALDAGSLEERHHALRRLGDVALFIAGMFSQSLNRKSVDVDYYISMGGNAYGSLSDSSRNVLRWQALSDVFRELAQSFAAFVEVLAEVREEARLGSDTDILRLYEVWVRTGSRHAARQLRKVGIDPVPVGNDPLHH